MCGQALAELLVVGALFVLLLVVVPLLGAYLDAEHKSLEAARTAAWERTVWAERAGDWSLGAQPAVRSDAAVRRLVEVAVLGHPSAPLTAAPSRSPVWLDHAGADVVAGAPGARAQLDLDEGKPPSGGGILEGLVSQIAFGSGVPGMARSLGLGKRGYATAEVRMRLKPHGALPDFKGATLAGRAAVLSDAWSASREQAFRRRVARAVALDTIRPLILPSKAISAIPLFKEGRQALPLEAAVDAAALPETERGGGG